MRGRRKHYEKIFCGGEGGGKVVSKEKFSDEAGELKRQFLTPKTLKKLAKTFLPKKKSKGGCATPSCLTPALKPCRCLHKEKEKQKKDVCNYRQVSKAINVTGTQKNRESKMSY